MLIRSASPRGSRAGFVALAVVVSALLLGLLVGWFLQPFTVFGAATVAVVNESREEVSGLVLTCGEVEAKVPPLAPAGEYSIKLPSGQISTVTPLQLTDGPTGATYIIESDDTNEFGRGDIDILVAGRTSSGLSGRIVLRYGSAAPPFPYMTTFPIPASTEAL